MSIKPADYATVYETLKRISFEALASVTPTPMIVGSPTTPLGNDIDPTKQTWFVEGGVCGFGYTYLGARSGFAKWLVANDYAWKSSGKGIVLRSHERNGFAKGGQSFERNRAIATALASYLKSLGQESWAECRID